MATDADTVQAGADEGALTPEVNTEAPAAATVESLAREMGWKPEDEFDKAKGDWRPAAEFIRSGHAHNKHLRREVKEMRDTVDRIAKTADRQVKREVEERTREIQARFDQAVENKDTAGAAAAANDMRQLERENAPAAGGDDVAAFASRNSSWFKPNDADDEATAYAISISQRNASKPVAEQLRLAEEGVRKRFPELFEGAAPRQQEERKQPSVNQPGRSNPIAKRPKTFADMPDTARRWAEKVWSDSQARGSKKDRGEFEKQIAKDFFETDQAA
jgi:hypothetical protein